MKINPTFPAMMSKKENKPLMRNLGEFFGHIFKGIKTDPSTERHVVRKETVEEQQGNVTLRRTTIEEIELNAPSPPAADEEERD